MLNLWIGLSTRAMIALYAMTAWVLVLIPKSMRQNLNTLIKEITVAAGVDKALESSKSSIGRSWQEGEYAMAVWKAVAWFELSMMILASLGWIVFFKLFGLGGPVWLTTFSFKSVLAVNVFGAITYTLAMTLTNDDGK